MKCVPSEFTIKYWSSQHEWWSVVSLNKFNIFYEVELYRFLQYPWSNFQSSVLLLKSCCKTDLFCVVATFKVTLIYCACNSKQVLIKITAYIYIMWWPVYHLFVAWSRSNLLTVFGFPVLLFSYEVVTYSSL